MAQIFHTPKSSHIRSISHDDNVNTLTVEFKNGAKYRYHDFSKKDFSSALANVDSIGKHFAANIKDKFKMEKLNQQENEN